MKKKKNLKTLLNIEEQLQTLPSKCSLYFFLFNNVLSLDMFSLLFYLKFN